MTPACIDTHLHLDDSYPDPESACKELDHQLEKAGIEKGIVLHLESQQWPRESISDALSKHDRLYWFANVHPDDPAALSNLRIAREKLGCTGLKLHPRLQRFEVDSDATVSVTRAAGEMGIPVLIDAFPDGDALLSGFHPRRFFDLALRCPDTRIILAHFGGHHVIDFMMMAKRVPNIYFDLSYSLLYYRSSAVVQNILYAMKSMRYERIFYGSDYPDRPIQESLQSSLAILNDGIRDADARNRILYQNAKEFFIWNER